MQRINILYIIKIVLVSFLINSFYLQAEWVPVRLEASPLFPDDTINMSIYISGIDCSDSLNCFATGNDAYFYRTIYKTTDGGRNWVINYKSDYNVPKSSFPLLRSLSSPARNKCVVGSDSGVILKTDNGGASWSRVNTPIYEYKPQYQVYVNITSVKMLDSLQGIAASKYLIIHTSDGGNSWQSVQKPDSNCGIVDIAYINSSTIYIAGACDTSKDEPNCPYRFSFFRSTDLGNTWEVYNYENVGKIVKMCFADSLNGWLVGGDPNGVGDQQIPKIYHTSNGGKSWAKQLQKELISKTAEFLDVSFKDKNTGIAVGRMGEAVKTSDGGLNWIPIHLEIDYKKPYIVVPYTCYRNVKEPLYYGLPGRILYYTETTDVHENINDYQVNNFSIFPNPATDFIEISLPSVMLKSIQYPEIRIYNVFGEEVYPTPAQDNLTPNPSPNRRGEYSSSQYSLLTTQYSTKIDVSALPAGLYFVSVGNCFEKFMVFRL